MRLTFAFGCLVVALGTPIEAATLAAGSGHTLAVSPDGRVWAWGDNAHGQLGLGPDVPARVVPAPIHGIGGVVAVAAGSRHSVALTAEGATYTWGANDAGQLGQGTTADGFAPLRVPLPVRIIGIAAGFGHSVALGADGSIWTWGSNSEGQLASPAGAGAQRPIRVDIAAARAIAAGAQHSVAVTRDGRVFAWGDDGRSNRGPRPSAVAGLPPIVAVSGGNRFTLALTAEGSVYGWGTSEHGQLGYASSVPAETAIPIPLPAKITSIAAGDRHALAVTGDGQLLSWGDDGRGQLGREDSLQAPAHVIGLTTIEVAAASFGAHSVALTTDGILWAWGDNDRGQVGDGTKVQRDLPVQITEPGFACLVATPILDPPGGAFSGPVRVSARCVTPAAVIRYTTTGKDPSAADTALPSGAQVLVERTSTVKVRAFRDGMPASNVTTGVYRILRPGGADATGGAPEGADAGPTRTVTFTPGVVAAGASHSLVLKSDGTVWSFGANGSGQLGDGSTAARHYPVQVAPLTSVTTVAAGAFHSVALRSDGTVWTWGKGDSGQIGNGSTASQSTPVQVLTGAVAIAAGTNHTLAVKSDGSVWSWGENASGQLGNGGTTASNVPVQVSSLTGVTRVAAGQHHSLALKSDGTVRAWGGNDQGQLGDGTTTQRLTPVVVDGATSIVDVAAGRSALTCCARVSMALRDDGAVLAWGYNAAGEIGDGTTLRRLAAVVSLMAAAGAAATGESHSIAARTDGTLWGWGGNGSGQIGDGTTTNRLSPVAVGGPTDVIAVAAGGGHTLAVTSTGELWAWGLNNNGQVGDGTTANRTAPRQVAEAGFVWKAGTPMLSPATGTYTGAQTVTVTVATPGVTIRYTTNGVEPGTSDTVVASGGTVSVPQDLTLKAKAWKTAWAASHTASETYTLKVATPTAAPAGGAYGTTQNVVLSCSTSGATIRYTTNGEEPGPTSTAYTGPIYIAATTMLKSKAFKSNWTASDTRTDAYTLTLGTLTAPSISPTAGTYVDSVQVTMSGPAGATIRYTTDGSEPGTGSTVYSGAITVTTTTTVKAKAFDPSYNASATASAVYTIKVGTPTLTPNGGTYSLGQGVSASGPSGATLRYTVNGADPVDTDMVFPTEGVVPVAAATLKVKAFRAGCTASDTESEAYTITGAPTAGGIAAGYLFSLAHNAAGTVWSWGDNGNGQMGDGTTTSPRATPVVSSLASALALAGGDNHSLVLKSDGTVWGVGRNSNGQLGDGTTTTPRTSPVQFGSVTGVVSVAAGASHTVVAKSDGTAWSAGYNFYGQIGDGTSGSSAQRTSPTQVTTAPGVNLSNVIAVAAGANHSLALKSDGSVWAWGDNASGQLGNGNFTPQSRAVQVNTVTGVVAIAAGANHSLAITSTGALWAWGQNAAGQLGDGSTTNRNAPVQVTKMSGVRTAAGGSQFTVVARADGSAWAWGINTAGQLGNGGTGSGSSIPVQVMGVQAVFAVAADNTHGLAIDRSAAVWAWGANGSGQIGDGTLATKLSPVKVSEPSLEWKVATPTLSPVGGPYTAAFNVTVSCATAGATIRYTTNGVDPTPSDTTIASGGTVNIAASLTLKAKAFKSGMPDSNVAAETYTFTIVTPAFSPDWNTYSTNQSVTIASTTPGTTIRYTTNGVAPSESSTLYTGPVAIDKTTVLKAKAWKTGWTASGEKGGTYTMKVGTPSFNPAAGSYTAAQTVTVTTATSGATLHYTLNGRDPTESDTVVASGSTVTVDRSATLRVKGWKTGWSTSDTGIASYTLTLGTVATPTFSPVAGTYAAAQTVTISSGTAAAVIRYTTDGTDPSLTSPIYYGPVLVDWTATLKAKAFKSEWTPSGIGSAAYTIQPANTVAPPAFSPPPGIYTTTQSVTLTTATSGALIHYTTNGQVPTESDLSVSSGGTVTVDRSTTLKAKAFKTGMAASPARRADYFVTGAVAAAWQHGAALKVDKTVWTWGVNGHGQIGNNTTTTVTSPTQVLTNARTVATVGDSGRGHTLAVKWDGTLWGWGDNQHGMLCDGSNTQRTSPVQASGITNAVAIAAGALHTLILKADGTVASCGYNQHGQLGTGNQAPSTTPVSVIGLSDVIAVAAGYYHSLALKRDGTLYVWGYNHYGQLGDGNTGSSASRSTPYQLPTLKGVIAIAAAEYHSAAVRSQGTTETELWTWGYNVAGQIGDGTSGFGNDRSLPVKGPPAVGVSAAATSTLFTALDATPRVSIWGTGNHYGSYLTAAQLNTSSSPLRIGTGDYSAVASGDRFSIAVQRDMTLVSWGPNSYVAADGLILGSAAGMDDPDGDGLLTSTEWMLGSDPWNADTNGDGIIDGAAVADGTSPTNPDMDGDGILNAVEVLNGTDPLSADSDSDGVGDAADCFPLDQTRWQCPAPNPGDTSPPVITLVEPSGASLISSIPPQ